MIGKKNIVFGFIYLVFTAALGPVMVLNYLGDVNDARADKQQLIGDMQTAMDSGFEMDLDPMTADQIARANTKALVSLSNFINSQEAINAIKGGPHTHGNLEAVLNILAGFLLCFLAVGRGFKQLISWVFILGALGHSGLLYLAIGLELEWAGRLLAGPAGLIGPSLVLLGLVLAGLAALIGFRDTLVRD